MQEQLHELADGAILFDAQVSPQVEAAWFDPAYWRGRGSLRMHSGGRGGIAVIAVPIGECVLRHYRRGGMIAVLLGDRYLWCGAARTRSFAELRLLDSIARLGLPGPAPVAARYQRHGLFYRADLITRRIADARTLAECLIAGSLDAAMAKRVGALVARFHQAGVWHADLNAHNILVTPTAQHLIDFDRGRIRAPAMRWRLANLRRLRRSLLKLGAAARGEASFDAAIWAPLMRGYEAPNTGPSP